MLAGRLCALNDAFVRLSTDASFANVKTQQHRYNEAFLLVLTAELKHVERAHLLPTDKFFEVAFAHARSVVLLDEISDALRQLLERVSLGGVTLSTGDSATPNSAAPVHLVNADTVTARSLSHSMPLNVAMMHAMLEANRFHSVMLVHSRIMTAMLCLQQVLPALSPGDTAGSPPYRPPRAPEPDVAWNHWQWSPQMSTQNILIDLNLRQRQEAKAETLLQESLKSGAMLPTVETFEIMLRAAYERRDVVAGTWASILSAFVSACVRVRARECV